MKYLITALVALSSPAFAGNVAITGTAVVQGFEPNLEVTGLVPGERVRVHSIRMYSVWEEQAGKGWRPVPKALHAWADFQADPAGQVKLSTMSPLAGTFAGADPYGILWSGQQVTVGSRDPFLPKSVDPLELVKGKSRLLVSRAGDLIAAAELSSHVPPNLSSIMVSEGRVNGAFAAPNDGRRHPVVILLHGSEGGGRDSARDLAHRFAGQGYAAFAFNYFAWDLAKLEGVPNAHVNQPIEMLSKVRDWLSRRPEADVSRLGVYGHSKGAEYAVLAATRLPWIDAVIGCVPTDVVWEGYGVGDGRNRPDPTAKAPKLYSSFSWQARPFPYVMLQGDRTRFRSNSEFYDFKRREMGRAVSATEIPIERSRASFLFLGGGRDEVWSSGLMAKNLDARMRRSGKGASSELVVYERAGHAICGEGGYPTRIWQSQSSDPRDPDLDANGRATVDAWMRIKGFFARTLNSPIAR